MHFARLDENQRPTEVRVDDERIHVCFEGGLEISVPITHSPRLQQASPEKRQRWTLIGHGEGIHWPDVDEDLSVRGLFQTYRELPRSPTEQIPALVSDLMKTTGRLNRLFPGKPFTPDILVALKLSDFGFEKVYNGHFPTELLESKAAQRIGQVPLCISASKPHKAREPLLRAKNFESINRWFTPELAEVA